MSDVTYTDEIVHIGYSRPVAAKVVIIDGERFAQVYSGGAIYRECWKCPNFSGYLREYAGLHAGQCYACNGTGYTAKVETEAKAISLAKRRITDRARRERKRLAEVAAQELAAVEWKAAHPAEAAALAEVLADRGDAEQYTDADYAAQDAWEARWGGFVTSLANQAQYKALSEKQTAAVLPAVEEAKAQRAADEEIASKQRYLNVAVGAKGVKVTGTITVAATFEARSFNGYGTEMKRIVIVEGEGEFEGVTVKMMGSGQNLWDAEQGQQVEVTGTVKDFSEYNGVPQTTFIRPKFKILTEVSA